VRLTRLATASSKEGVMLDYRFGPEDLGWDRSRRGALMTALRRMLRSEFPEARRLKVVDYGYPLVRIINLLEIDEPLRNAVCSRAEAVYFDVMTQTRVRRRH
jgi:hypothetical protein